MFVKIIRYAWQGTLFFAIKNKLGLLSKQSANPDHYHGETAKNYLKKRLKQEFWHKEQLIVRDLLVNVPNGSSVLDVAFGTGRFVDMYLEKNMSVYGIDISEDMLAVAKEELGEFYDYCHIELGSADSLPYKEASFDLVVCFRFFGLIPFDMARRVLSEIHRVSRGVVIVRVPVRKRTAKPLPSPKDSDAVQGRLYENEIIEFFSDYGFVVQEQRLIGDRGNVDFIVYVLSKSTSTVAQESMKSGSVSE